MISGSRSLHSSELISPTKRASQVTPAGFVDRPAQRLHFLVLGRATGPAELARTPLRVQSDGNRVLLGDVATVPHRCNQLVLAHHAVAVAHEMDQQVEDLRLQMHAVAVAPQFLQREVDFAIGKAKMHAATSCRARL